MSVQSCRKSRHLTQEELAFQVGVSVKTMYNIEKSNSTSVKTALRIAKILDYSVEEIFSELKEELLEYDEY